MNAAGCAIERAENLAKEYEKSWIKRLAATRDRYRWLEMARFEPALEEARRRACLRLSTRLEQEGLTDTKATAIVDAHPLTRLAAARGEPVPDHLYVRLSDHCLNMALSDMYRAAWHKELSSGRRSVLECAFELAGRSAELLFLERWASAGHPAHPLAKARAELLPEEVIAYASDFRSQVALPVLALDRDSAHVEEMAGSDEYVDWFARHFPDASTRWRAELRDRACDARNYLPLPVHPWQLQHRVRELFHEQLASGTILLTRACLDAYAPLSSLRTLSPSGPGNGPDIKLPIDIRLTSVNRTISARTCIMGPQVSRMLEQILATDTAVSSSLSIQAEDRSVHFVDSAGRGREKQLNVVYRRNLDPYREPGDCVLPCFALPQMDLEPGRTLLHELVELRHGSLTAAAGLSFFSDYVNKLLPGLLRLYLVHGIALEAHEQNTLLVCDARGSIRRFIIRDLAGIRVHLPTIQRRGFDLRLPEDRLTMVELREPLRQKFTHALLGSHLWRLVSVVVRTTGAPEGALWRVVYEAVRDALHAARSELDAESWSQEFDGLLASPWQTKAFTRMLLAPEQKDIYWPSENPLSRFVSAGDDECRLAEPAGTVS